MKFEPFTCPFHQTTVASDAGCPTCVREFQQRPNADLMTPDARVDKCMQLMNEILTIPFGNAHEWITELVGREVWTHEIGLNPAGLVEECRLTERPRQPDIGAVIGLLEDTGKPVVVVAMEGTPDES